MKNIKLEIDIISCSYDELDNEDKRIVDTACKATDRSYAPYSNFYVGAALLLENGEIITGNNQENAAYPSGLCAERTTIFYANSKYPDTPIVTLAIAARNKDGFLHSPISPCGACRQVILETEKRFGKAIKIILYSTKNIYILNGINSLLPFSFDANFLE